MNLINFVSYYTVLFVIDGDGFKATNNFSKQLQEFRLYGIDAPENKLCKKLKKDEKELHVPGSLLIELGKKSTEFLRKLIPTNTTISIMQESVRVDLYGRNLCYAYLPNGDCINRLMVSNGYAKPFPQYYCHELKQYQILNTFAKQNKKGLYSIVPSF